LTPTPPDEVALAAGRAWTAQDEVDPPGRWLALAWLAVATLLAMTTWFSASAVLGELRVRWHLSSNEASLLTIAVQLGFVAGALVSAIFNLADIVPPRRLILVGAAGASTVNALLAVAGSATAGIPLRFLTGAFLALVYAPALKAMATWFRRGRGTALGIMVGGLTVGSAMPHLVRGALTVDWRVVVLATSALTLIGGLLAVVGRDGPYPFPEAVFDPRQAGRVFADRGVRLASLGYFGHMWELYAMWAWFAVFFGSYLAVNGKTDATRGAAFATFAVIGVGGLGCWVGGIIGDRWGRTRATALAMALSGSCALVIGPARGLPAAVVLVVGLAWGFWVVADSAQFSTMVTELAPQKYVGTAVTLQLAVGFSLTVVTIWLVPVLSDHLTWTWAFAFLAPGPAIGIAAMLQLMRAPEAALIGSGRG